MIEYEKTSTNTKGAIICTSNEKNTGLINYTVVILDFSSFPVSIGCAQTIGCGTNGTNRSDCVTIFPGGKTATSGMDCSIWRSKYADLAVVATRDISKIIAGISNAAATPQEAPP